MIRLEELEEGLGEDITEWDIIEIKDAYIRIYYKPHTKNNGFTFYCLEIMAWDMDKNVRDVKILFHGTAYYDGVVHLYMGHELTNNYGYIYMPYISKYNEIFKELNELVRKYCSDEANV